MKNKSKFVALKIQISYRNNYLFCILFANYVQPFELRQKQIIHKKWLIYGGNEVKLKTNLQNHEPFMSEMIGKLE